MAKESPPDFFKPQLTRPVGVRRLNNRPLYFGIAGILIVIFALIYSVNVRQAKKPELGATDTAREDASASPLPDFFANAPSSGVVPAKESLPPPAPPAPQPGAGAPATAPIGVPAVRPQPPAKSPEEVARDEAWARYRRQQQDLAEARTKALQAALDAPPVKANATGGAGSVGGSSNQLGQLAQLAAASSAAAQRAPAGPAGGLAGAFGGGAATDPNGQGAKIDFLNNPTKTPDLLPETLLKPISPYELRAGAIIPCTMISGINSDLPGMIIGQVRETVYDTATGNFPLIPQGARVVGRYDNGVTYGQERVLVVWNRIIYPDASSLDLDGMPGVDQAGYAGFNDEVNNHYLRIFGSAAMMSLFSAGIQLSQPQAANGQNISPGQTMAGSIGQQMGETGRGVIQKNLNIQPTLEIRPGYLFNVMVSKDIVFPGPWSDRRGDTTTAQGAPRKAATYLVTASINLVGPRLVGWELRGASNGTALIAASAADGAGTLEIVEGRAYPEAGLGRVDAIFQRGDQWFVQTSRGWIAGGGL